MLVEIARFHLLSTTKLVIWLLLIGGNNVIAENVQQQTQQQDVDPVVECRKSVEFQNATDPWMGPPEGASLDNMCLVRCVMELQSTIVDKKIDCGGMAKAVDTEVANLRRIKISINAEGWKKGSEICCKDAVEAELSVGDENNSRPANDYEGLCMRAHFLWHCDFQIMAQNIPEDQFQKLMSGTWNPEEAGKKPANPNRKKNVKKNKAKPSP